MTKEEIIEQLETSLNEYKGLNEAIDDAAFYIAAEFEKLKQTEISDEEIEAQALTFAKEESYGELNSDLWKGYVFGAKRMRKQLK